MPQGEFSYQQHARLRPTLATPASACFPGPRISDRAPADAWLSATLDDPPGGRPIRPRLTSASVGPLHRARPFGLWSAFRASRFSAKHRLGPVGLPRFALIGYSCRMSCKPRGRPPDTKHDSVSMALARRAAFIGVERRKNENARVDTPFGRNQCFRNRLPRAHNKRRCPSDLKASVHLACVCRVRLVVAGCSP